MNISSYCQETMCYVGQNLVFEEASNVINNLTGSSVNAKQIERICHLYGGLLERENQQRIENIQYREYSAADTKSLHYVMADGAMFSTREKDEPWKEIKLARIFKAEDILYSHKDKNFVEKSLYVAHLGSSKDFFPKLEYEIENLKNIVIISDGAKWIWNWAQDSYPNSIQILDYYHAKEHLCEFAIDYFKDEIQRNKWIEIQTKLWLEQAPELVIENIKLLEYNEKTESKKRILINYYTTNIERMRYKNFTDNGLIIGSGAIESAHKSVLQSRLKLSGQHWSKEGLQQMAQLRVVYKSHDSYRIKKIINAA
jgi:hypothetical protein